VRRAADEVLGRRPGLWHPWGRRAAVVALAAVAMGGAVVVLAPKELGREEAPPASVGSADPGPTNPGSDASRLSAGAP
jgi:hypothetical protein